VVNLADAGGDRYLKATLRAVSRDDTLPTQIARDRVLHSRIRDKIITVLTAKRYDDVSSPIGKETLRRELAHEVNKVLAREAVEEILFVEFVVQ
jgi:flagellar FliL protein